MGLGDLGMGLARRPGNGVRRPGNGVRRPGNGAS